MAGTRLTAGSRAPNRLNRPKRSTEPERPVGYRSGWWAQALACARSASSPFLLSVLLSILPSVLQAVEASAPVVGSAPNYVPGAQVRLENDNTFSSLVPSPILEAQSAAEYAALIERARENGTLLPASDPRVKRARTIAMRIAPFANKWSERVKEWNWEINVVRSSRIGMLSLPGGKMLIYTGLLDRIQLHDDELGMLLGHEIAHALREQVRERLAAQQTMLGASPMPQLFGVAELDGAQGLASGVGPSVSSIRYDATDETEADVIGGDIAARAGFDPRGALPLWDKLANATRRSKDGFIHVHPYSEERRHAIIKRLPAMLALYAKARGVTITKLPPYGVARQPVPDNSVSHP